MKKEIKSKKIKGSYDLDMYLPTTKVLNNFFESFGFEKILQDNSKIGVKKK